MKFANKVLALSLAAVMGPLLALAAHQVSGRLNSGSGIADDGDGVIITDGLTPYECNWDSTECVVTGNRPGGGGAAGGGGGGTGRGGSPRSRTG